LFVGIDLAARHSAALCIDEEATPVWESVFDAGPQEKPARPFIYMRPLWDWWLEIVGRLAETDTAVEDVVFVVEDVYSHAMDDKPAVRLQGALLAYMALAGIESHLITAHTWQNYFGYSKKKHKDSKKWATRACEHLGYLPGSTLPPGTKILAKPKTDLRDAYLLAEWLRRQVAGDYLPGLDLPEQT